MCLFETKRESEPDILCRSSLLLSIAFLHAGRLSSLSTALMMNVGSIYSVSWFEPLLHGTVEDDFSVIPRRKIVDMTESVFLLTSCKRAHHDIGEGLRRSTESQCRAPDSYMQLQPSVLPKGPKRPSPGSSIYPQKTSSMERKKKQCMTRLLRCHSRSFWWVVSSQWLLQLFTAPYNSRLGSR